LPGDLGSYTFSYDTGTGGWGELNRVTLPSGAQVGYQYALSGLSRDYGAHMAENPLLQKTVTWTDQNLGAARTETTTYCIGFSAPTNCVNAAGVGLGTGAANANTVRNPDGGIVKYVFSALTSFTEGLGNQLISQIYDCVK